MCAQFESRPVDVEFVHLMHDLQSTEIIGHKYRGYTLLTRDGRELRSIEVSTLMWHWRSQFVSLTISYFKKNARNDMLHHKFLLII
jgi:hypothetical protein